MITANAYYDGNVKSLGFENGSGRATVGVMEKGDYEFSTGAPEKMTLISGAWALQLPESDEFVPFGVGETVSIPGDSSFKLQISEPSAYHCMYM
ncbi:MAG: pyrimidine/purine nucleoside phosphorylase [Deltaproteobacteria bacterium]|nr:pyrimidine/purine nucleoside phosphorylase [Deltaproteobacteria bacterium]